ncbi:MAG: UDP-N-acetylmuramoyl-L-alanyl-D-glutamate--2,6-diaminopimelate ligase [Nitrospirota bacterium]
MKLGEVIAGVNPMEVIGGMNTEITSVNYDSRKTTPGSLFCALRGLKSDGAAFISSAVEKGAAAVLFEDYDGPMPDGVSFIRVADARLATAQAAASFYGRPSSKLDLVGITGTNGKTTASYLIRSILRESGSEPGLIGTISYEFGGRRFPAPNTTPESVDLQALLAEMVKEGAKYAVMEVSSHAVALKRVSGCDFKVKLFTNFTQDHLDFHGTMEEYFAAKKALFTGFAGINVLNADDPKADELKRSASGEVITYGVVSRADVSAKDIEITPSGTFFRLITPAGEAKIKSRLVGRHNLYNLLSAAGAAIALGISLDEISHGLACAEDVPGRLERVDAGQDFTVLVDYAHTEDALSRALTAARELTPGRLIAVFGCGGDRDRTKRPKMGKVAASLADIVILTSDNPRTEDPLEILMQAEAGALAEGSKVKGSNFFTYADRAKAISFAVGAARGGDTILIAGKGHEDYQIIGATKHHFDDRETAKAAVLALRRA